MVCRFNLRSPIYFASIYCQLIKLIDKNGDNRSLSKNMDMEDMSSYIQIRRQAINLNSGILLSIKPYVLYISRLSLKHA